MFFFVFILLVGCFYISLTAIKKLVSIICVVSAVKVFDCAANSVAPTGIIKVPAVSFVNLNLPFKIKCDFVHLNKNYKNLPA